MLKIIIKMFVLNILLLSFFPSVYADGFVDKQIERQLKLASNSISIDVSDMQAGAIKKISYVNNVVYVYRRTKEEIDSLKDSNILLSDQEDSQYLKAIQHNYSSSVSQTWTRLLFSFYPKKWSEVTRSIYPEFFVFGGWGAYSGCLILENKELSQQGKRFLDPCVGAYYDSAGRVFSQSMTGIKLGEKPIYNLYIPPHYFSTSNTLVIGLKKEEPLKALPSNFEPKYLGLTPSEELLQATSFNNFYRTKLALERGAEVNNFKFGEPSPLDSAINGSDNDVIQLLLEAGAVETPLTQELIELTQRWNVNTLLQKYKPRRKEDR